MKEKLSPKVEALYKAVMELLLEGKEIRNMKISEITQRAGIGKGTAYEYFESREELLIDALNYYRKAWEESVREELLKYSGFMEKISCLFHLTDCAIQKVKKEALREICNIFFFWPMLEREKCGGMMECLSDVVEEGKRGGGLRRDFPDEYIVLTLSGKIFSYISYYIISIKDNVGGVCTAEQIKGYLLDSIRQELVEKN